MNPEVAIGVGGTTMACGLALFAPYVSARSWSRLLMAAGLTAATLSIAEASARQWLLIGIVSVLVTPPAAVRTGVRIVIPILAGVLAAVAIDASALQDGVESVATNPDLFIVLCGLTLTILVGGEVVAVVVSPLGAQARESEGDDLHGHPGAGRRIGWLERSLIFLFVTLGEPEAAALVFAAKSIARFGSLDQRPFAEYFLVGSLSSLAIGVLGGVGTRIALGLPAIG